MRRERAAPAATARLGGLTKEGRPDARSGAEAARRRAARSELLAYFDRLAEALLSMSAAERAELEAWERAHVTGDGTVATDDWPGWAERIGPSPRRAPGAAR